MEEGLSFVWFGFFGLEFFGGRAGGWLCLFGAFLALSCGPAKHGKMCVLLVVKPAAAAVISLV